MKNQNIQNEVKKQLKTLRETLDLITKDPSIPNDRKLTVIIHVTSLVCAIIAIQPIPFADIFILTPIQVLMVMTMSNVLGNPVGKHGAGEIVASVAAVVGWGVLAQQLILGAYKTVLPFMGAITTVPLVYAANTGLGYAAKAVLEARSLDQTISAEEIRKIKEEAEKKARAEKRDWSKQGLLMELNEWKSKAKSYGEYINELKSKNQEIEDALRENVKIGDELEESKQIIKELESKCSILNDKLKSGISEDEYLILHMEKEELESELNKEKCAKKELEQKCRNMQESIKLIRKKKMEAIKNRFRSCYPSISFHDKAWKDIEGLSESRLNAFERQMGILGWEPNKANFRSTIHGTSVRELKFDGEGRIYITINGRNKTVYRVGNKASQTKDIDWLTKQIG